jgi:NADH-quinone oxidoreductase subunit J
VTLFWILAIALTFSALFTVTAKQPVYSVIGLLANFALLATMYLTLCAEFIGVVQILVYSGAIVILFVFVIALLSSGVKPFEVGPNRLPRIALPAAIAALFGLGGIAWCALRGTGAGLAPGTAPAPAGTADSFGSVSDFGQALFGPYLLPFEVTALILMVAVIGVVMLTGDGLHASARSSPTRPGHREREPIVKAKLP